MTGASRLIWSALIATGITAALAGCNQGSGPAQGDHSGGSQTSNQKPVLRIEPDTARKNIGDVGQVVCKSDIDVTWDVSGFPANWELVKSKREAKVRGVFPVGSATPYKIVFIATNGTASESSDINVAAGPLTLPAKIESERKLGITTVYTLSVKDVPPWPSAERGTVQLDCDTQGLVNGRNGVTPTDDDSMTVSDQEVVGDVAKHDKTSDGCTAAGTAEVEFERFVLRGEQVKAMIADGKFVIVIKHVSKNVCPGVSPALNDTVVQFR